VDDVQVPEPWWLNLAAGMAAALVGMISFGVFHTIWILDVPAVFVEGLIFVVPAGLTLGWAIRLARLAGVLRGTLRAGVSVGFFLWLSLVPYEVVGVLWGPWPDVGSVREGLSLLWLAFLGFPVGALLGWFLTTSRYGAAAWGLAALAIHFMLGGTIAFFGGRNTMLGLFAWLLPTHLAAGVVLVGVHRLRPQRYPGSREAASADHDPGVST